MVASLEFAQCPKMVCDFFGEGLLQIQCEISWSRLLSRRAVNGMLAMASSWSDLWYTYNRKPILVAFVMSNDEF